MVTSGSGDSTPPEVISGDHLVYAVVTDFGTSSQSEQWVSHSMGESTISNEPEMVEATLHENALTQQYPRHGTLTVEGTLASVPQSAQDSQFDTLGLTDADGEWKQDNAVADIEAFRVHTFNSEPDPNGTPLKTYEFVACKLHIGEITHSVGDPGEVPFVLVCNGDWRAQASTPPA